MSLDSCFRRLLCVAGTCLPTVTNATLSGASIAHRRNAVANPRKNSLANPVFRKIISTAALSRITSLAPAIAIAFFSAFSASWAIAKDLPQPTEEILLTITGNITHTNQDGKAVFDLPMLEALESTDIVTKTAWTEGKTTFTGVRLSLLLETIGAKSAEFTMTAEDGYIYELRREIDLKYPVVLAYKKNDEYMSVRQLGPLWLMFPFDDFPELDTEENRAASVWQLTLMEIK